MKNIILSIFLLASINALAQKSPDDSAYTKNLPLRATSISFMVPRILDPANDSLYSVFIKWRASLRNNPVNGNTTVSIDTIPTIELANMYAYVLQLPAGLGIIGTVQNQLATARAANPYLEKLCKAIEDQYAAQLASMIAIGRKLLLGK